MTANETSSSAIVNFCLSLWLTLSDDLVEEILCRLPVKLLLQCRSVCKLWNSLISGRNFAKKHLTRSTTHWINSLGLVSPNFLIIYPPNSVFNTIVSTNFKHLEYSSYICNRKTKIVSSCNGILCLAYKEFILLWNPSIHKLVELPHLQKPHNINDIIYGFGYDSITDNYKVVAVLHNDVPKDPNIVNIVMKTQVKVNTMGTNFWKNIEEFPYNTIHDQKSGKYLSGTINWLASTSLSRKSPRVIVSLDLGKESFQEILQPDYGEVNVNFLTLDVMRNCLCMISGHDVWIMKEYGIKESWTKLFTISQDPSTPPYFFIKVVYVFEDGQVLFQSKKSLTRAQLIVYDPRICTFNFVRFGGLDVSQYGGPEVCIESLISPCS